MTYTLGDVATIFAGGDKPKSFSESKNGKYKIPVFANGETNDGLQGYTDIAKVNVPSVTVSARGTIGYTVLRKEPFVPIVRLLTLIPKSEYLDVSYLYYYLKLNRQKGIGSSQSQLIAPELASKKISIPNKTTQHQIASVLSSLDAKIELNNKINAELEAMAKTIYDYWFVQFDFPNAQGKPYKSSGGKMVYNEQLKREIPEGWVVCELEKMESNIITGKTPVTSEPKYYNGEVPFICIGDVRGNMHIVDTEIKLTYEGANTQVNKYIPAGAICVTCIASPGLVGFASKPSQTNQQLNSIVCSKNENKYFLYFYLKDYFKYARAKTGNTFANMNKGDFSSILVIKPSKNILIGFTDKISSAINQILNNSLQNQQLTQLRDWLLPMLMNGQVTVGAAQEMLGMVAEDGVGYEGK